MNKKELYEQPSVLVFTVQTEGVVCTSTDPNNFTETFDNGGFGPIEL